MDLLRPVVRPYPWGTCTAIADLQGRPVPAPGPEAELWMGAHPSAPSGVDRAGSTLDAVIAADPDRELGPECAKRFSGRLPFLLKVLSAGKALSIQVHPSRAQAEAGFAAENERGLLPGDPGRNYVDDWPKPELLYALTPFEVAAGLRTPADAAAILRALAVDQLQPLARPFGRDQRAGRGGRAGVRPGVARARRTRRRRRRGVRAAGRRGFRARCGRLRGGGAGGRRSPGRHWRAGAAADAARGTAAGPGGVHARPAGCTLTCGAPGSSCSPTPTTSSAPVSPASTSTCPNC